MISGRAPRGARGLKQKIGAEIKIMRVAPHAGAWIETSLILHCPLRYCRAPRGRVD